jgi:two-component system chemotaxis response regulator CheB
MSFSKHEPSRVLIADDSELMRTMLADIIGTSPEFRVVGQARTGYEVIRLVHETDPDIITLDLAMPDLGGLDTLAYIMSEAPRPVVVVSAHVAGTTQPALQALECGALELVAKPAGDNPIELDILEERVLTALRAAREARLAALGWRPLAPELPHKPRMPSPHSAACAVAIAASTGGPRALTDIIPRFPADLPAAILIVQHMPPAFTKPFADRLATLSALPVLEAREGDPLRAGCVYIARGGVHMSLERTAHGVALAVEDTPPLWGVRPAADVLFAAVAKHFGPASAGIVLTGMGRDGADGLRAIHDVGGWTAVQDPASSVVHGMPKAAAPYADDELPLHRVPDATVMKIRALAKRRQR